MCSQFINLYDENSKRKMSVTQTKENENMQNDVKHIIQWDKLDKSLESNKQSDKKLQKWATLKSKQKQE